MPGKRRAPEERIAAIDKSIAYHHGLIAKLEAKKRAVNAPKTTMRDVSAAARNLGLSPEDVIAMLKKKKKTGD